MMNKGVEGIRDKEGRDGGDRSEEEWR